MFLIYVSKGKFMFQGNIRRPTNQKTFQRQMSSTPLSYNQKRRIFSQTSKVSSAINLIDDFKDESDQTLASDNEDSDKENNEDVNELQEVSCYFY